jgi:hypothetical protein
MKPLILAGQITIIFKYYDEPIPPPLSYFSAGFSLHCFLIITISPPFSCRIDVSA